MVDVTIDPDSGFCFGVVNAIRSAERELSRTDELYSLGDIVHNSLEVDRLQSIGLHTIEHADLAHIEGRTVLLRAHGEPPSTYRAAHEHHIRIIDATFTVENGYVTPSMKLRRRKVLADYAYEVDALYGGPVSAQPAKKRGFFARFTKN